MAKDNAGNTTRSDEDAVAARVAANASAANGTETPNVMESKATDKTVTDEAIRAAAATAERPDGISLGNVAAERANPSDPKTTAPVAPVVDPLARSIALAYAEIQNGQAASANGSTGEPAKGASDETIPGGKYINPDGVTVNAHGQPIEEDGTPKRVPGSERIPERWPNEV